MTRAQVWSMDIIIAVVIFLVAISIFYVYTQQQTGGVQARLLLESELVAQKLASGDRVTVITENSITEERLFSLLRESQADYGKLKAELGLRDDFCIILVDEEGYVLPVSNGTEQYIGVGNGNLTFNLSGTIKRCQESY